MTRSIYLVGSLTNPEIPIVANRLRDAGHKVFDDWYAPGPETDSYWTAYEKQRGKSYLEALNSPHARHAFSFDLKHLNHADTTVLVLPCGKSGHLELGYQLGRGIEGHILMQGEPEKWDLMYRFANGIWTSVDDLIDGLRRGSVNVV